MKRKTIFKCGMCGKRTRTIGLCKRCKPILAKWERIGRNKIINGRPYM